MDSDKIIALLRRRIKQINNRLEKDYISESESFGLEAQKIFAEDFLEEIT